MCLVCSTGGHLTEMEALLPALEGHERFWVSYDTPRTRDLAPIHFSRGLGRNPLNYVRDTLWAWRLLRRERPGLVLSTGSEVAIPVFLAARALGIPTLYVESVCRVTAPSGTGKIMAKIAREVYVQWPGLQEQLPGSRYEGGLL